MNVHNIFIKNGIILTCSSVMLKIISIIFNIFLSNKISSNNLGIWYIVMSIFSFLLTIALSGINLSSTRLVSKERSYGCTGNIPYIMNDCFKYCFLFNVITFLVLLVASSYLENIVVKNSFDIKLLYLLALALPFCSISSCLNGYFMAMDKIKDIIISQFLEVSIQIFVILLFYFTNFFSNTHNICLSLILSTVVSDFIAFLYLLMCYKRDCKKYKSTSVNKDNFWKEILKISLPVAITTYIKSGLSTIKATIIPLAFVKYGCSQEQSLSYFGLISGTVFTLILFPFTFIQSFNSLLVPKISSYDINKSIKKIKNLSKKSIYFTLFFSILTCVLFITLAHIIDKHLYKSLNLEQYIKIFAPIIVYIYIDNVVDSILKSIDSQIYVVLINIIDLLITIALIYFFIPIYGLPAYIIILYLSEILNVSLSLFVLNKKLF